mgnify:CR=1 FL=1
MCHENELIDLVRRWIDDLGVREEAIRLLTRIDEETEVVRRARDPYGTDFRP